MILRGTLQELDSNVSCTDEDTRPQQGETTYTSPGPNRTNRIGSYVHLAPSCSVVLSPLSPGTKNNEVVELGGSHSNRSWEQTPELDHQTSVPGCPTYCVILGNSSSLLCPHVLIHEVGVIIGTSSQAGWNDTCGPVHSECSLEMTASPLGCYSYVRFGNMEKTILLGEQQKYIAPHSHQCMSLYPPSTSCKCPGIVLIDFPRFPGSESKQAIGPANCANLFG